MLIARYTFYSNIDTLPIFDNSFVYEYTDINNGDGTTTRSITANSSPNYMSFSGCMGLTDVNYLNVSNITDMSYMFEFCESLMTVNSSDWNVSNVESMGSMFFLCCSLEQIDVSNWDVSNVTDIGSMFFCCESLLELDVSRWDVGSVTNMELLFCNCCSLNQDTINGLKNWNVSNVESMSAMIDCLCTDVTTIDLSGWDVSNVTDMYGMLEYNTELKEINLNNWILNEDVDTTEFFLESNNVEKVSIKNSNVFTIDKIIAELPDRTGNSIGILEIGAIPASSCDVATANSKHWNVYTTITIAEYTFYNSANTLPIFNDGFTYTYTDVNNGDGTTTRTIVSNSLPTSISFSGCIELIDVNYLDTSNLTDMSYMFDGCELLTTVNSSDWDVSHVESMGSMFFFCCSLEQLDVSNWDVGNVTDISYMFFCCESLSELDFSKWDVSNVTNMEVLFCNCCSFSQNTINGLRNWDVSNVEYMSAALDCLCTDVVSIDLSNWDVSNVIDMSYLLEYNEELKYLNLDNWILNEDVDTTDLLIENNNLEEVSMMNSNAFTVNKIIAELPTRTSDSIGTLNITGVDDISQVDIAAAESKYWIIPTLSLSEDILNINVNQTKSIYAITDKDVVWESDNENILIKDNNITNLEQIILYGNLCSVEYSNCELTQTYNSFNVTSYSSSNVTVKIKINNLDPNETYTFSMGYLSGTTVEIYYGDNYQGGSTSKMYTITGSDSCTFVYYRNSGTTELWGINNLLLVDSNGNDNSSILSGKILYITGAMEGSSIITCTTVDGYETCKCIINISNIDKNNVGASRGLISWKHNDFLYKTDLITNTMKALNLNVLHQQFSSEHFEDLSALATSINNFRNNMNYDIEISSIIGDPSYYLPEKIDRILTRIDSVINLNSNTNAHIDSIFIDIEPWAISGIEMEDWLDDYKNNMQQAYNYCKENELKFILCVPFWLDSHTDIINYNANYYKEIIDICDELVVMNFNRSGQIKNIKEEIEYCKLTNKRICSIAECQYFSKEEDAKLSYFNEDHQAVNSDWLNLYNAFDYEDIGFIFHCFHDGIIDWVNAGKIEGVYNPYVVEYTFNKTINTLPTVNDDFIYTYIDIDNNDDTITRLIVSEDPLTKIRFESCEGLLSLDRLNISNLTTFRKLFYECVNLQDVESISCYNTVGITDISYLFYNCNSLTELDISNWDTSNVTDMHYMFYNCNSLTSVDVSNFNTSKVTDMDYMFCNCNNLTSLDVSNFDTNNVTYMHYMFYNCNNLTSIDVSNWNTSNVKNMYYMFYNCVNLISLDVSNWDVSKVNNMQAMFQYCRSLASLDVSNWDVSNVINMHAMFHFCSSLTTLDLINWDTSNVTRMDHMFQDCYNLISLDVSNFNTSNVTDMNHMFDECKTLTVLEVGNWDTSNVTDMSFMFSGSDTNIMKITSLDVSNWNTSNVTTMRNMFYKCYSLTSLDVSNWDTSNVTDMSIMFDQCQALTSIDVSKWDVSNVTTMYAMFFYCINLTSLDVSKWDTSNVTTMQYMFQGCSKLTTLDVSNFDTSNVTDMNGVFNGCNILTTIGDVSKWNTSNVTTMAYMFYNCNLLTSIDVSNWDTANVTKMHYMFQGCNNLTSLDVSNFDTSKVTSIENMFYECSNLTSLDVGKWNTSKVTSMRAAFYNCNNLTSIDVSKWDTSKVTDMVSMFSNCQSLTSLDISNWDISNIETIHALLYNTALYTINISNLDLSHLATRPDYTSNGYYIFGAHTEYANKNNLNTVYFTEIDLPTTVDYSYMFINRTGLKYVQCNNINNIPILIEQLPARTAEDPGFFVTNADCTAEMNAALTAKNWTVIYPSTENVKQLYLCGKIISNLYIGEVEVKKVCLGDIVVYENK